MKDSGFTLIELLIVSAIIGILALLAIPNYALFKSNAYNATAASDMHNIEPAAELVASQGGGVVTVVLDGAGGAINELPGATTSPGTLGFVTLEPNHYFIETHHPNGSLRYQYDSDTGTSVLNE